MADGFGGDSELVEFLEGVGESEGLELVLSFKEWVSTMSVEEIAEIFVELKAS